MKDDTEIMQGDGMDPDFRERIYEYYVSQNIDPEHVTFVRWEESPYPTAVSIRRTMKIMCGPEVFDMFRVAQILVSPQEN